MPIVAARRQNPPVYDSTRSVRVTRRDMEISGIPVLDNRTGARCWALVLTAALPVLALAGALLLDDGPRDNQLLFAAVASMTVILAGAGAVNLRRRHARQLDGLLAATRRLGRREFAQIPGNALQEFDASRAWRLGQVYADAAARLRRQFGKLESLLEMDRWLLSVGAVDETLRGVLPLIAEVLQCRAVSVVMLDELDRNHARCFDFLLEANEPVAAPRVIAIDANQLQLTSAQTPGLEIGATGVNPEEFLAPLAASGAQAFRLCPIEFRDQVRGFLCVGYRVDAHAQEDAGFGANEIAERLGLALAGRVGAAHGGEIILELTEDEARKRSPLETGMQRALQREEFALAYQPIVAAHSRHVSAVEALVRWPNGSDGISRTAAEFIPVAEDSGLIVDLGDWVLRTACAQFDSWRRTGLTLDYVAVNISARQLRHSGLLATVLACLQRSNMQPSQLQLEITEDMLREGPQAVGLLRELAQRGVRLALDDFGDGNSSLSAVRDLPVTALKIDRSCVAGLGVNESVQSLVRAVIGMGAATGKLVIAEGVEESGQLEFLEAAGCDALQGFLFAPALPAAEIPAFVAAYTEAPSMVA
jgi:EAL domain-containing protein (putative c-di-GMP-specific phosphodiesterase class I)